MNHKLGLVKVDEKITIRTNGLVEKEYYFRFEDGSNGYLFKDGEVRFSRTITQA